MRYYLSISAFLRLISFSNWLISQIVKGMGVFSSRESTHRLTDDEEDEAKKIDAFEANGVGSAVIGS